MQVIPPDALPISRQQYLSNLRLREAADLEVQAERRDRLNLLFLPERVAD